MKRRILTVALTVAIVAAMRAWGGPVQWAYPGDDVNAPQRSTPPSIYTPGDRIAAVWIGAGFGQTVGTPPAAVSGLYTLVSCQWAVSNGVATYAPSYVLTATITSNQAAAAAAMAHQAAIQVAGQAAYSNLDATSIAVITYQQFYEVITNFSEQAIEANPACSNRMATWQRLTKPQLQAHMMGFAP